MFIINTDILNKNLLSGINRESVRTEAAKRIFFLGGGDEIFRQKQKRLETCHEYSWKKALLLLGLANVWVCGATIFCFGDHFL